jgi:hypothetical protein
MNSEQIHESTVAEIARLTGVYNTQRQGHCVELAALFSAAEAGQPESQPAAPRAEMVRGRAVELLNGFAPAGLKLPPAASRRQELEIEIEALDLVLDALSKKENVARAEEAAAFAVDHGEAWAAICRDVLLCATRLGALEARAIAWRQKLAGVTPASLPLARYIGHGRPLGAGELSRAITEALETKIISKSELRDAADA